MRRRSPSGFPDAPIEGKHAIDVVGTEGGTPRSPFKACRHAGAFHMTEKSPFR